MTYADPDNGAVNRVRHSKICIAYAVVFNEFKMHLYNYDTTICLFENNGRINLTCL